MPTRSTKLGSLLPAAGVPTSVFTVPAGLTYLVKAAHVGNEGAVVDTVSVYCLDAAGVRGVLIDRYAAPALTNTAFNGWVALNPGDQLICLSSGGLSHFWISGAKLVGVA